MGFTFAPKTKDNKKVYVEYKHNYNKFIAIVIAVMCKYCQHMLT